MPAKPAPTTTTSTVVAVARSGLRWSSTSELASGSATAEQMQRTPNHRAMMTACSSACANQRLTLHLSAIFNLANLPSIKPV